MGSWLQDLKELSQLGGTALAIATSIILYRANREMLVLLLAAKDAIAQAKGESAREMIEFLKAAREAGLTSQRKPPES